MYITCGREICGELAAAESREWLVTNGIGGYACGTIAGLLTRHYHGLLMAALKPPLGQTLLLVKLDETADCGNPTYPLHTNRWADGTVHPHGYRHLQRFHLEGTIPVWTFACGETLLEKRVWMQQGKNTTYVRYTLKAGNEAIALSLKALVNYRDRHGGTTAGDWQLTAIDRGVCIRAFPDAVPLYLLSDFPGCQVVPEGVWYEGFDLAIERYRGTGDRENHRHAATWMATLLPGQSWTIAATTEDGFEDGLIDGEMALVQRQAYERELLEKLDRPVPPWIEQLVLAANQFIVDRPLPDRPDGKTILAGYPWFGDWGRDTAISLPGLTLCTGRAEIARTIIATFADYLDRGMLPNVFPDAGDTPAYNSVDASLWYFEAVWAYYDATNDREFLAAIAPKLADIIHWYRQGTRYGIHLDASDGLIYAGEAGVQLTWMDAKVDDWVVTPRQGKAVEINALWYNALQISAEIACILAQPDAEYQQLATQAAAGFERFWHPQLRYCYDVLDTPQGNDAAIRPNAIFAVSLSHVVGSAPLLSSPQQKAIVETCSRVLLTSFGLRSLSPDSPHYRGQYGGDRWQRDGAYHQGTVWGWLIGPFVQAYLNVGGNSDRALSFLEPIADHLRTAGLGSISEIFDGDAPMFPRGCFAQAWSVAEVLRGWRGIVDR
jgi:predicted glycogen debranching enzyme